MCVASVSGGLTVQKVAIFFMERRNDLHKPEQVIFFLGQKKRILFFWDKTNTTVSYGEIKLRRSIRRTIKKIAVFHWNRLFFFWYIKWIFFLWNSWNFDRGIDQKWTAHFWIFILWNKKRLSFSHVQKINGRFFRLLKKIAIFRTHSITSTCESFKVVIYFLKR